MPLDSPKRLLRHPDSPHDANRRGSHRFSLAQRADRLMVMLLTPAYRRADDDLPRILTCRPPASSGPVVSRQPQRACQAKQPESGAIDAVDHQVAHGDVPAMLASGWMMVKRSPPTACHQGDGSELWMLRQMPTMAYPPTMSGGGRAPSKSRSRALHGFRPS